MDFTSRLSQPPAQSAATGAVPPSTSVLNTHKQSKKEPSKWGRWGVVLSLATIFLLVLAIVAIVSFGGNQPEGNYIDTTKLQAVFLNTGQVYFGNIKSLNNKYLVLDNIYYLQTSGTGSSTTASAANTRVSLVKLGCELHAPYDQMVINQTQVTFWENLQDNGQVAKAVKTFEQQNPGGQKCADQSQAATPTNSVQTTNPGTTPSSKP
ncbi:MAG TPA: hypothetical protein VNE40_03125 [Candidatus Dormibacteraeota bacterium]|nr:hypothetical protein [Candidatus Dormibacteraeota bacterium]